MYSNVSIPVFVRVGTPEFPKSATILASYGREGVSRVATIGAAATADTFAATTGSEAMLFATEAVGIVVAILEDEMRIDHRNRQTKSKVMTIYFDSSLSFILLFL